MTAPLSLDHIRSLHAGITPGPWFQGRDSRHFENEKEVYSEREPSTTSEDICTAWHPHDAAFIAAAPSMVAHLLGIVERVEALHKPVAVYEYDSMNGVFALDEDGEQIEIKTLCSACTGDSVLELIGDCEYDDGDYHDETAWPCPTIKAITGEGGA